MPLDRRQPRFVAVRGARIAAVALALGLAVGMAGPATAAVSGELVGTFRISAGRCDGAPTGSYFRMILPSGSIDGPWIDNADSRCGDRTYTLLAPGTDGGLVSGTYQSAPKPGFDSDGNSLAAKVIAPVRFFGVDFSASTEAKDLQTGAAVPVPSVHHEGGKLGAELPGFDATWNKQVFNQGSPKPDGSRPGLTAPVSGTYDASSGAYVLTWTSQIVGGPFDGFTGLWHLEGTFVPADTGRAAPAVAPSARGPGAAADPGSPAASDDVTAPSPEVAAPESVGGPDGSPVAVAARGAVQVEDDAFAAPVWLVVALAGIGISGVLCLLALGRRTEQGIV